MEVGNVFLAWATEVIPSPPQKRYQNF